MTIQSQTNQFYIKLIVLHVHPKIAIILDHSTLGLKTKERTKENGLVIQIQKALWRKLEPLFCRNKKALRFKGGQRKCACIRGQILPTRKQ